MCSKVKKEFCDVVAMVDFITYIIEKTKDDESLYDSHINLFTERRTCPKSITYWARAKTKGDERFNIGRKVKSLEHGLEVLAEFYDILTRHGFTNVHSKYGDSYKVH